jgi:CspA family cold shock protein
MFFLAFCSARHVAARKSMHGEQDMEDNGSQATETGIVKWFNEAKGYGFITPDNGGKDLFAHFREIRGSGFKTLPENAKVRFAITQGAKGPQASSIEVIA